MVVEPRGTGPSLVVHSPCAEDTHGVTAVRCSAPSSHQISAPHRRSSLQTPHFSTRHQPHAQPIASPNACRPSSSSKPCVLASSLCMGSALGRFTFHLVRPAAPCPIRLIRPPSIRRLHHTQPSTAPRALVRRHSQPYPAQTLPSVPQSLSPRTCACPQHLNLVRSPPHIRTSRTISSIPRCAPLIAVSCPLALTEHFALRSSSPFNTSIRLVCWLRSHACLLAPRVCMSFALNPTP